MILVSFFVWFQDYIHGLLIVFHVIRRNWSGGICMSLALLFIHVLMEEAYRSDQHYSSSDSSFEDDIDNISLLPEIKSKPNRIRRKNIRLFREHTFDFNRRNMCSKTVVYTSITAVLLVSVVVISIFVKPSSSEEYDDLVATKRSGKDSGPKVPPEDDGKVYLDKNHKKFPHQKIRLPSNMKPEKYRIKIKVDLSEPFEFKGHVQMLLKCEENTNYIFFHAKHMNLSDYELYKVSDTTVEEKMSLGEIAESSELEMFSVKVPEGLVLNHKYVLYVKFSSKLSEKLFGFYKSTYKNSFGEERYIATTHFEPTDARAAFPCMDEPALKAKFEIILVRPKGYTALSNMPLKSSEPEGEDYFIDKFEESVLMSTYLVAFVISDFKSLETKTPRGIQVRVWAPPEHIEEARFALDEASKILNFYEQFFHQTFPLPKQDLIAIPDFPTGAMENWGLITYRSTSMLYSPLTSSDANKQWVSVVVAHELAHQWFGNLVTMDWWNDLWLNEGFASFMENMGVKEFHKDWKMMDQFLLDKCQLSMNLDQMSNSHPISVSVHNPSEINALFDTISYDKGASIIRMLKSIIGENAFREGLQNYLKDHRFANAQTKDLWNELGKVWKKVDPKAKDVSKFMGTWTLQMGFPVVKIEKTGKKVVASQKHFLVHPNSKPAESPLGEYIWQVPLTYTTEFNHNEKYIWMDKQVEITLQNEEALGWFKANYEQKGFYRVNYDIQNWDLLTKQLNEGHQVLSAADRSGLIDDAFNLARAGQLDLSIALGLTLYLVEEKDYVPWSSALSNLGYIHSMLCSDQDNFKIMQGYLQQQLLPILQHLGWEDNQGNHLQKYLRETVWRAAITYGNVEAKIKAMTIFNNWKISGTPVPPNLRGLIYSVGVKFGGEKAYNFVFKKFEDEKVAAEKKKLMYALSSSSDPKLLQDLLEKSLDPSIIRTQDTVAVIDSVAGNCLGRDLAWNFVKKNYQLLFKRYAAGSFDFSRMILRTTSHYNIEQKMKETKEFFENHDKGSGERAVKQSQESIEANIKWMKDNLSTVLKWMEDNTKSNNEASKTLQELKNLDPSQIDQQDRGYARNDYYYDEQDPQPRYRDDDYYHNTQDNYRYRY